MSTLDNSLDFPLAYLITFTCYGTWLHGRESGSVDPKHNIPGTPFIRPNEVRQQSAKERTAQPPYELDAPRPRVVLATLKEVCAHHRWQLVAAHVRTKHVHAVVQAATEPERILNSWRSYSSRNLNHAGFDTPDRKRWTRHGSTRYLWKDKDVHGAIHYVLHEQGEPMETYDASNEAEPRP